MLELLQAAHPPQIPQDSYLYIRYSTDEQGGGDSARRQLALGTEYAAKNGLHLPKEHILEDFGISAYRGDNIKTGKLGDFMKLLASGKIRPGSCPHPPPVCGHRRTVNHCQTGW